MKPESRSPIKDKPLRQAGQSLLEERQALWEDQIQPHLLGALMFVIVAGLEWWRWYMKMPPSPVLFSLVALAAVAWAAWRVVRHRPKLKALRLGAEGEKAVGQFLERMLESGYQVFHDVVGPGFNVDHVLIGRAGIFTIETKTWSKPAKGDARITFSEGRVLAAGYELDRDPIVQARAHDLLAALVLEVHVDVRRLVALLADEAFEQHAHARRVHLGHPGAVADHAVGRTAAALAEDVA